MAKNILIVEDDPLALYGISKALKRQALEIITAPTGKTALEKLSANSIDLCLVNMHLKDCDAVELIKKIKGHSPETKIIVMSARSLNHRNFINKISHPDDKGSCYFMTKPFNLCQMNKIVAQALKAEDFPGEFGLAENETAKRKCERTFYNKKIRLFLNVIESDETSRWSLSAKSVDISDDGIGLVTDFPLKVAQIVDFDEGLNHKSGVVIWSKLLDDRTCRAGIKFTSNEAV